MDIISRNREEMEIKQLSPLVWAYVGDAVYEMYIRTNLINNSNMKPHKLHLESIKYVKAQAQAKKLEEIKSKLTDEEKDIVRRGRNVQNHHLPKNTTVIEYAYSTAFEALLGYLYLTKNDKRLKEILDLCSI